MTRPASGRGFPYRAVVWDLDGTLVDTLRDLAECVNAVLALHGLPGHPPEAYRRMVGNGVRALLAEAAGGAAVGQDALLAEYTRLYGENCLKWAAPYDGIPEVTDALGAQGVRQFVVTNKPDRPMRTILAALFPPDRFDRAAGQTSGRPVKPDPVVTLELLAEAGIAPGDALFIGDSDVDMLTAAAAGMDGAGACWGFRGRDELAAAGARYLLEQPEGILAVRRDS